MAWDYDSHLHVTLAENKVSRVLTMAPDYDSHLALSTHDSHLALSTRHPRNTQQSSGRLGSLFCLNIPPLFNTKLKVRLIIHSYMLYNVNGGQFTQLERN